jgi:DNA-binding transcriptional ArsR family regulator
LKKFFLNSSIRAHLRGLESEFGESSNAIRIELNRFESAGLLKSMRDGNKKLYQANKEHPLFVDIHNIIIKDTGIDLLMEKILKGLGKLFCVYLTGDFAHGRDSQVIELILVGDDIDRKFVAEKMDQAEELTGRKVKYILMDQEDAEINLPFYKPSDLLPLWHDVKSLQMMK